MNTHESEQRQRKAAAPRHGAEMLLFLVVSFIGIYALGNGLTGLFEPGKGINLLWLAVAVAAMMILFAQMGRVHDTWPRRRDIKNEQAQPVTLEAVDGEPRAQAEERERRST